ncbi:hypothetical protein FN846DRAFT_165544 [Sphaerosporella brunnea]|jgi:hypothetical protein|uniref:Tc1-like transposase DDE domain-containing protein n=1 Tax=Sphaerosporella brunnea TaxID=1250544 RepID=A0A5J5ERV9_9PEZI|nr:hypothetical protein FN846DRAFT_165544 [Sphaerosporella brunnea]
MARPHTQTASRITIWRRRKRAEAQAAAAESAQAAPEATADKEPEATSETTFQRMKRRRAELAVEIEQARAAWPRTKRSPNSAEVTEILLTDAIADIKKVLRQDKRYLRRGGQDFRQQKTKLEEEIRKRGHICIFLPKFHPEISPIEYYWGTTKVVTRKNCECASRNSPSGFEGGAASANTTLL